MKRPNVARMRRAMARGERDRLLMNPRLVIGHSDIESAQITATQWHHRVRDHFPNAQIAVWRDGLGTVIAEWRED